MHPSLVPNFYWPNATARRDRDGVDNSVLGCPAEVAIIEVYYIIVLDARPAIAAGQDIPDRLVKASRNKPPLR
jgi:hypothetical protein